MDGYLGWPLAQYLTSRGHEVAGADAFFRRKWVSEMKSESAVPIYTMEERLVAFKDRWKTRPLFMEGDLTHWDFVKALFEEFRPDAVVHLGECPSAPYSMIDAEHATWVQMNNILSTMNLIYAIRDLAPGAHLLKLGTMGEYGTPNIDIPEGFFEIEYRGRKDRLPFPRQAGSWYHWSKVHGSNNIMFACRTFGLRSTDVMQGVVFGSRIDEMPDDSRMATRLDFDQAFGTAINRFGCQAVIGHPLTPFGRGHQRRGFLPLQDSMQCLALALENPPQHGEYRVFNQFEEVYAIDEVARKVQTAAHALGLDTVIRSVENPRLEMEEHHYRPDHEHLRALGYRPTRSIEAEIKTMLLDLMKHRGRIASYQDILLPDVRWNGQHQRVEFLAPSGPAQELNQRARASADSTAPAAPAP